MHVTGSYFDKDFDYIEVDIVACEENCLNEAEIVKKQQNLRIRLL